MPKRVNSFAELGELFYEKPILMVLLGRQLAGPTHEALKASSRDEIVVCAVKTATPPVVTPMAPVPTVAAPVRNTAVTVTASSAPEVLSEAPASTTPVLSATGAVLVAPGPTPSTASLIAITTAAIPATDGAISVTITEAHVTTRTMPRQSAVQVPVQQPARKRKLLDNEARRFCSW